MNNYKMPPTRIDFYEIKDDKLDFLMDLWQSVPQDFTNHLFLTDKSLIYQGQSSMYIYPIILLIFDHNDS